jgi:hypothetical protein
VGPSAVFDLAHEARLGPQNALVGAGRQTEVWFGG